MPNLLGHQKDNLERTQLAIVKQQNDKNTKSKYWILVKWETTKKGKKWKREKFINLISTTKADYIIISKIEYYYYYLVVQKNQAQLAFCFEKLV